MKILITGSTGFVGRHLVPELIQSGNQVLEITRDVEKSNLLFGDTTTKIGTNAKNFKSEILAFNPEIAIHLASYLTASDQWSDVQKLVNTNILYLSKVLDAVAEVDLKCFINTGTFAEYFKGDNEFMPAYYYAATKTASRAIVDYYANTYGFKQTTIVPYSIYGGQDSQKKIIDIIFDSITSDEPLQLSPGEQVLDFIHMDDVVSFYKIVVANYDRLPQKSNFKLGTGKGHSLKQLAKIIETVTNGKTNIAWGAKDYRKSDVMYAVADLRYAKRILDWRPRISLKKGIKKNLK